MEYKMIKVDSSEGFKLQMEHAIQDSDTLLILLPGAEYNIWGPSFYYSYSMASELGFDVLSVVYGFEKAQRSFDFNNLDLVVTESKNAIDIALDNGSYSRIIFIARSLGTLVMSELFQDYKELNPILIYHSPIRQVMDCIRKNEGLVVLGTNDTIVKHIDLGDFKSLENIELHIVEGGDHSLDVDNFDDSIVQLKLLLLKTKEYILSKS